MTDTSTEVGKQLLDMVTRWLEEDKQGGSIFEVDRFRPGPKKWKAWFDLEI